VIGIREIDLLDSEESYRVSEEGPAEGTIKTLEVEEADFGSIHIRIVEEFDKGEEEETIYWYKGNFLVMMK
jgi:CRISPR/Cas system-associated protein endoribonuclease Cas2